MSEILKTSDTVTKGFEKHLGELEEKMTGHTKQIKKQQEELEGCYSSDQRFAGPLHAMQQGIRKIEKMEENIFGDIRKAIKDSLTHIHDQRKQTNQR